jgi:NADH-quinone oxidoreductase subunit A
LHVTPLVAYALLFVVVGSGFILVHLLAGKLIRPNKPSAEKKTIYECGEPTIGSAWIQFDLRFYVVALLFVIFDVEVAFFFPWAEVFGKANAVANAPKPVTEEQRNEYGAKVNALIPPYPEYAGARDRAKDVTDAQYKANQEKAQKLAWLALFEILVFFGVLLVGFAYLWKRGDLAWVRSTLAERPTAAPAAAPPNGLAPSAGEKMLAGSGS